MAWKKGIIWNQCLCQMTYSALDLLTFLSVILEKFAIMPVSSAKKKSASHFLMSVKYVLEKNVNNFNL